MDAQLRLWAKVRFRRGYKPAAYVAVFLARLGWSGAIDIWSDWFVVLETEAR